MKDRKKTKQQPIEELSQLRQRIAELEALETKHKRTEEELKEAQRYTRGLIEASLDPLVTISPEGKITDVNHATELVTGYPRESLIGTDFSDHFTNPPKASQGCQQVLREGSLRDYPLEIKHCDGKVTPVFFNASVYHNIKGDVAGVFATARDDITEFKRAEDELRASDERFRSIVFSMSDWVWETDEKGAYTFCSEKIQEILGYTPQEIIGMTPFDLMPQDEGARVGKLFEEMVKNKQPIKDLENWNIHKDGHRVCLLTNGVPKLDPEGNLIGYQGVAKDITESKKRQDKLKWEKKFSEALIESISPDVLLVVDRDRNILRCNRAIKKMFGYTPHEVIGKKTELLYASRANWVEGNPIRKILDEKGFHIGEAVGKTKEGCSIDLEISTAVIKGHKGAVLITRDITERKRAEKALRESEERYRQLAESAPDHIFIIDSKMCIQYSNHFALKEFGFHSEKIIGKHLEEVFPPELSNSFKRNLQTVLKSSEPLHVEDNFTFEDKELWLDTQLVPLKTENGQVESILGISRDITEHKQVERILTQAKERAEQTERTLQQKNQELQKINRELKEAHSQLLQREKLASIGQLAAGIAHEINNPAGFVSSNLNCLHGYINDVIKTLKEYEKLLSLCKKKEDKDLLTLAQQVEKVKKEVDIDFLLEDIEKTVGESLEGTERITKIVRGLKDFSHIDEAELRYVNINEGIESTLKIVWNELKYKAEVIKEYGDLPAIECYPQQLNQVFMNLLVNAAQAIEEKGQIWIKTYNDADHIYVEVKDTGKGMSPEVKKKIFDPFFTTKGVGRGTGLGLSMSYGIVKKHKGEMEVESQEGKGSTFRVKLPLEGIKGGRQDD